MEGEKIKVNSYKDLIAWQKAMDLVVKVYALTKTFPTDERFGLISQMNRAAVSIPSNIAEGWGRNSTQNYIQFLRISRASLFEIETQLEIAQRLNFISPNDFKILNKEIDSLSKVLNGLINSISKKLTP